MKNLNDLALQLCKYEGKTKQVNVAQMKEIVKCLRELIKLEPVKTLRLLLK